MAYDVNRVKTEFINICGGAGVEVNVPILINARLTRTLGRVMYTSEYGHEKPIKVEFSKQFIETATDNCIYSVLQHEAAHYITTVRTKKAHGHDTYFKEVCAEIGCTNDKTTTEVELTVAKAYKYDIICENCNKIVASRSRKCDVVNNPRDFLCSTCKKNNLKVVANW